MTQGRATGRERATLWPCSATRQGGRIPEAPATPQTGRNPHYIRPESGTHLSLPGPAKEERSVPPMGRKSSVGKTESKDGKKGEGEEHSRWSKQDGERGG